MILIDGSQGEGGGQILRTSLTLSLVTGQPFRMTGIRAGRKKPGLLRQHLTAVQAAAAVGTATLHGDTLGSKELEFRPGAIRGGDYRFAIGTAGSTALVLQTVLPALWRADGPSALVLEGGTDNPHAPPVAFLERCYLPVLRAMGAQVELIVDRRGFYPAGGGRLRATIEPSSLRAWSCLQPCAGRVAGAEILLAHLPHVVAERECAVLRERLGLDASQIRVTSVDDSACPGNVVHVEIAGGPVTEICTAFGERSRRAEAVADEAAAAAQAYLNAGAPVGEHLADQMLIPLAMAGSGGFRTVTPSGHTLTNRDVIRKFLPVRIDVETGAGGAVIRVDRDG